MQCSDWLCSVYRKQEQKSDSKVFKFKLLPSEMGVQLCYLFGEIKAWDTNFDV